MSQFILLSGPSCIGKSPLIHAVWRFYPEWRDKWQKLVLYNNRPPRIGEMEGIDYYFRSNEEVLSFQDNPDFITLPVRNDLQALEINSIFRIQEQGKIPLFEGNPYIVEALRKAGLFDKIKTATIFLSPLTKEEIQSLKNPDYHVDLETFVTQVMRKKQLRRKRKQVGLISLPDLEDIEIRCKAAYREMCFAWQYDYVIPNHDGEDSENWNAFHFPLGDARKTIESFISILSQNPLPMIEKWEQDLLK